MAQGTHDLTSHVKDFQTLIAHFLIAAVTVVGFYLQWRRDKRRERRHAERHDELKRHLNGNSAHDEGEDD